MPNANDLIGKHFGYLEVVSKTDRRAKNGGIYWRCICHCGMENCLKEKDIMGQSLLSGKSTSCGAISKEQLQFGRGLNFNDLTNQRYGALIPKRRIEDVIYNKRKFTQWECICDCGRIANVLACNLVTGNTQSCGFCNETSHGNIKISQILDENHIKYIREKRFDTCRNILPLPFDFYVNNMYCIEFDGRQHFEATKNSMFQNDDIVQHDNIKSEWCQTNNIPLIRIPYTHYNDLCIEDLLLETTTFLDNAPTLNSRIKRES